VKALNLQIIVTVFVLFICPQIRAQTVKTGFSLVQNKTVEKEILGGQTHAYQIKADKEQFLHIVIDQKSANAAVALYSASSQKVVTADNPNIKRGPEQIFFITPSAGTYDLEITSKENGRYRVSIEALRAASPSDRSRIEAELAFIEGESFSASTSHAQALVKYEEAYRLIAGFGDRFGEATILFSLGKTHNAMGDVEKAADYFGKARALFQTAGSWDELFKDLKPFYPLMGGRQEAFKYLSDALPLVRALKNERLEAILLNGISKVCEDLNQPQEALNYSQQSLEIFRITGKRGTEIFTLTEIGDADLSLEDKMKAVGYLNQAVLLSRGATDRALEASLYMGIGYIYSSIDEHQSAITYFRRTLPLWRELKDKNGEAYSLSFIGTRYFALGESVLASEHVEQSVSLFREVGDLRGEAYSTSYLGVFAGRAGDSQKALEYQLKALKIFRDAGDRHGEASTLGYLAEIYWARAERPQALESYQKALSIWRTVGSREGEALSLSNLGFIHEATGDSEKASSYHGQALPVFRLLGNKSGEAAALYGLARAAYTRGSLDDARAKIESAINLIESLRTKIASSELRASYLATYRDLYEFYIELLMHLDRQRPLQGFAGLALHASERARARSLLDLLSEAKAEVREGIKPDLRERELKLQKQLNAKDRERNRPGTVKRAESLDSEIRSLTAAYQELQAEIKVTNPLYSALTHPKPASLVEIQRMLDPETVLLEYSLGTTSSYLWLVSQNSVKAVRLPKKSEIEAKARTLYEALRKPGAAAESQKASAELGTMLIKPALGDIANKRLAIVPDGVLSYIPFAAMTVSGPDSPLIAEHEVVYLPSASALAALRMDSGRHAPAGKTVAVFADPVFDAIDTRVGRIERHATASNSSLAMATREAGIGNSLPRLPATRSEASTILALVSESERMRAVDFDANIESVKNPEIGKYRILHFATHGLVNSVHPELSGIVLSLVDEQGNPRDGFLRLNEIYNLKLDSELVVLSACQTALGKEIKGEGLVGLTRGFMYAGSPRVVASLWPVDDQATAELMRLFYQGMLGEKKLRPAAALREAQIAMSKTKRFASPYFWAAFTIQGEWK
jgi:CHAT domain-containing protein